MRRFRKGRRGRSSERRSVAVSVRTHQARQNRLGGGAHGSEIARASGDRIPVERRIFLGTAVVVRERRRVYLRPMTDAALTPPAQSIDETLAELVEEFDLLGDWEPRIEYVIELGKGLTPLPDHARVEANKVPGCAAVRARPC